MRWTMRLLRKVGLVQVAMVMGLLLLVVYMLKTVVDSQELGALTPHIPLDQQQPRQVNVHPPPDLVNRRRLQPSFNSSPMNLPEDLVYFKRDIPLIWIGGVPRSGTTLMRAMVDAHPDIRCGEETRVIPRILGIHAGMTRADLEMTRLKEAKITEEVLNSALGAYILSIISKHGEPAPRLCNKDPFTLRSQQRLLQIFPNSKFILMIRDGRATVHSIISRKVSIKGFDNHSYKGALKDWNRAISTMYSECLQVGEMRCLPVYYEQLVLHPRPQMERILSFLDVPWDAVVLHHEQVIGKKGGVSLSKKELSTDQVNKPVNTEALSKWVGHIPPDVRSDMRNIAPMLETLGYDPDAYPPNYGMPDSIVHQKLPNINGNKNINQQPNDSYNKVKHKSNLYQ